jgi:catechol-2,3-dioxygenase
VLRILRGAGDAGLPTLEMAERMIEQTPNGADLDYGISPPGFRLPVNTAIGAVRLQVSDLQRSLAYYHDVVGMRVITDTPTTAALGAIGGERRLYGCTRAKVFVQRLDEPRSACIISRSCYPGALFLSAGGYHHHLGTNTWASGGRAAADQARLLEWELVVPRTDDSSAAARSVAAAGYAVEQVSSGWTTTDPWGTSLRIAALA